MQRYDHKYFQIPIFKNNNVLYNKSTKILVLGRRANTRVSDELMIHGRVEVCA